jgi:hypothetical protein
MKKIRSSEEAKYFLENVSKNVQLRLFREMAPDGAPQATPPPPPAPPQQSSAPSTMSVSKVASGEAGSSANPEDLQKGNITIEMIVEKLNSIRSGRSFKDQNILAQMSTYFDDLNDNEKLALYAFLKGISQIVTGEISGEQAMDPQKTHPELEVTSKAEKQVHSIKPNIIKKPKAPSAPQSQENTTAPTPIVPKTR